MLFPLHHGTLLCLFAFAHAADKHERAYMKNGKEDDSCGKRFADGQSSNGACSRDASRRLLLSSVVSVGLPASGELFDGVELLIMRVHVDDTSTACDCALPGSTVEMS